MTDLNTYTGAVFSDDHKYRYALWRKWKLNSTNHIMFIGLNPSRANETFNDPTITRLINFSKDWGYDGMYMANLFAWRTPYTEYLKSMDLTPYVGDNTDGWIQLMAADSSHVVICYGAFDVIKRDIAVIKLIDKPLFCFGKNANGSPKHPLYLKKTTKLIEYM